MNYWYSQFVQTLFSGRLFDFPKIRVIKYRAYKKLFDIKGSVMIGYNVHFYRPHHLEGYGKLCIGEKCYIRENTTLDYSGDLIIENNVTISEGTKIYSHEHDISVLAARGEESAIPLVTTIKNGAWIGAGAIILGGVTIGENSVVGAGSVVTHDVPDDCIYAGNPAKMIKETGTEKNISAR